MFSFIFVQACVRHAKIKKKLLTYYLTYLRIGDKGITKNSANNRN